MDLGIMMFVGLLAWAAIVKIPGLLGPRCKYPRGRPKGSKNKTGHKAGRPKGDQTRLKKPH